jgi:hypothetical protein
MDRKAADMAIRRFRAFGALAAAGVAALALSSTTAMSAEGASGVYLLGLRGPNAAITPPEGIFLTNQFYVYDGKATRPVNIFGRTVLPEARLKVGVNISSLTWVTPVELFGARLGLAVALPVGHVDIRARLGPLRTGDSLGTFGDPSATAFLGWKFDNFHIQIGATGFFPIGDYREGALANVSKNRGALDLYSAVTWADPNIGLSISAVAGYTANRTNKVTDYRTGNEFHFEGAIVQKITNEFSLGLVGYHYQQVGDDRGQGTNFGAFRGRTSAVGGMAGYTFMAGKIPISTQVRVYKEVDVKNRFKGNVGFLSISMPLWVAGAGR